MSLPRAEGDPVEPLLRGVPYLRDLDRVSFARLIGALDEVLMPAGAVIAEEGATADALYRLQAGAVRVTVASPTAGVNVDDNVCAGYFGDLSLLLQGRTASSPTMSGPSRRPSRHPAWSTSR